MALLLLHSEIVRLHKAVITAGLAESRTALLSGIDPHFVAQLASPAVPSERILQDLYAMNTVSELADGSVPLAVWLKNAIALSAGRAEAATFQEALHRCETQHVAATTMLGSAPPPELGHAVDRSALLGQVRAALRLGEPVRSLCILLGPSGFGKSHIAGLVFKELWPKAIWYDCRAITKPISPPTPDFTIIFDNVEADHPLVRERWLRTPSARGLITTADAAVAKALLTDVGLRLDPTVLVNVGGVDAEQALQFLDQAVADALSESEKRAVIEKAAGAPFALQAVIDLVRCDQVDRALLTPDRELNADKFIGRLLMAWANCRQERVGQLLWILANLPFIGMSYRALSHVIGWSQKRVEEALSPAVKKGFLREVQNHHADPPIVVPHDIVKRTYGALRTRHNAAAYFERYARYSLDDAKHRGDAPTVLDAWVAGMRGVFENHRHVPGFGPFLENLRRHRDQLPSMACPAPDHRVVAWASSTVGDILLRQHCSEVLAVAYMVTKLPPSSPLAEAIWRASRHPVDGWARAAAIVAACLHWHRMNQTTVAQGKLFEWFNTWPRAVATRESDTTKLIERGVWRAPEPQSLDLDEAAAVGALCSFGALAEAESMLKRMQGLSHGRPLWMTACTLAVWYATHLPSEHAQVACSRLSAYIPEVTITQAVRSFLKCRSVDLPRGNATAPPYNEAAVNEVGFAELTQSAPFLSFVLNQPGAHAKFRLLASPVLSDVFGVP